MIRPDADRPTRPPVRTLLHVFPGFAVGGSQVRLAALANHFAGKYRHLIVALDGIYSCCERFGPEVDYRRIDVAAAKGSRIGSTLANWRNFRRMLKGLRPDLLITYNWGAIEWALANYFRVCPHIHVEDGFGPEEADRQLRRRVLFRRFVLARADRVVLPSRTLHDIAGRIWRLPEERLCYLPNGIDCARFAEPPDPAMRTRLGIAPDDVVIGTLAGLRPEKNLARLIHAFAAAAREVPAKLVIVGQGPERDALERLAAELGLGTRVVLAGHVDRPERVIGLFDVFALSSDTEQMPYSVIEAMAAARPVASTDVGDVKQMVAPDNRDFIVAPDAARLGQAIATLIADSARRRRIGQANQTRAVAEFDAARMFAAYDRLFDTLAGPAARRS